MKLDHGQPTIIESLQRDGRRPFTALAREVGISEAAVRARVQKLTEAGVIDVVAVTNPLMVGFDVMAMVGIQANSNLEQIADAVSAWDETSYVVILSGSFDLMVEIVCADNQHLLRPGAADARRPRRQVDRDVHVPRPAQADVHLGHALKAPTGTTGSDPVVPPVAQAPPATRSDSRAAPILAANADAPSRSSALSAGRSSGALASIVATRR